MIEEILKLKAKIDSYAKDPVTDFVANYDRDLLHKMQIEMLERIFTLCKKYKVRYIFLGDREICGCEDARVGPWPAMWSIAEELGFPPCAGNTDQYHCNAAHVIPDGASGGWDVESRRKLTDHEVRSKNFHTVLS